MREKEPTYKVMWINSALLEIPRGAYQRELNVERVHRIVKDFDERIANEPKVSSRDGHYYVFDGQHTIAARKQMNNGKDLPIECKVYLGLSDVDEALLFAQQFGDSARLSAGARIRALIYAKDPTALAFQKANEELGVHLDYEQDKGKYRIACTSTAFSEFNKVGNDKYKEAIQVIIKAWNGIPDSFRKENLQGIIRFLDLYDGEYSAKRLIKRLSTVDPLTIYREGKATGVNLVGYKRYLYQVLRIYNGKSEKSALPLKF